MKRSWDKPDTQDTPEASRTPTRRRALELTILVLGITLGSLSACEERATDVVAPEESVIRAMEEPPDPEVEHWEYVSVVQGKLEAYERRIATLHTRLGELEGAPRSEVEAALTELERDHGVLEQRLEGIKKASEATWEKLRPETDRALEELESDYARVVQQLRPATRQKLRPETRQRLEIRREP